MTWTPPVHRDTFLDELFRSSEFILDEIAEIEEDIRSWELTVENNRKEIPELERQALICERDIAVGKLKVLLLRHKLSDLQPSCQKGGLL